MEGPVPFLSSSDNPLEIPQIPCPLHDQDLTEMHQTLIHYQTVIVLVWTYTSEL